MGAEKRLAIVVSAEMTIKAFLMGHLAELAKRYRTTVLANTNTPDLLASQGIPAEMLPVRIVRPIRPAADLAALYGLVREFRYGRFACVLSVTPKAGLLAMLAGAISRVPVRIHIFTGQVWATRSGLARLALKAIDRLTASLATCVLADSESQRQFLIAEGVVTEARSSVLASGSISGVNVQRFKPDPGARNLVRSQVGVGDGDVLLLFIGRLNYDKGVLDLARAFRLLGQQFNTVHLLFVGPDEGGLRPMLREECGVSAARLHFVDFTNEPERFMAAADILCLPSYREGFGSVVIEAAAVGIPAVASRIYGVTDAVVDGNTGLLHPPGDVRAIVDCLERLAGTPVWRKALGEAARNRVLQEFSAERVTVALVQYLEAKIGSVV